MTFVRAQRYLLAGESAASSEHFFALCMRLGRIHTGIRKICVSANVHGSCRAAYLESVLLSAGYRDLDGAPFLSLSLFLLFSLLCVDKCAMACYNIG